jgi:hypothetical protein
VLVGVLVTGLSSREMVDLGDPRIQHLQAVAARNALTLDVWPRRPSTRSPTAQEMASEVGREAGLSVPD